jgi:hypothetical protein
MKRSLGIDGCGIVIIDKPHNPKILTPDFLKNSSLVPIDWELAQPQIWKKTACRVVYQNSLNRIAQLNNLHVFEGCKIFCNP